MRLFREDFRHVEHVGDAVYTQHTTAAKSGVQHFVAARERAGVRGGGLRGGGGASGLNNDNRLAECDFTGGGQERTRVANRLHVDDDTLRLWVAAQVVNQVAPTHVEHRANGDKSAETDVFAEAPIEYRGAERPA